MEIIYSKKDGKIEEIKETLRIVTIGKFGFWGQNINVRDNPFWKIENISIFIHPTKVSKGMASKEDEEPRMNLGDVYKLTLKRIKKV